MIHPNIVDSCGKYNFTIVLTQNSVWNGYNMSITYNGSEFPYINGTANITGITYYNESNQSYDPVPSFEPTKVVIIIHGTSLKIILLLEVVEESNLK